MYRITWKISLGCRFGGGGECQGGGVMCPTVNLGPHIKCFFAAWCTFWNAPRGEVSGRLFSNTVFHLRF